MPDGDNNGGANGRETPVSAAHYIRAMTDELAKLALRNGLGTLGYLLEVARLEADHIVQTETGDQSSDTLPPP
jgi:hypothetical protein